MSLWGRVFARVYDRAMAATEAAGLRERRSALLSGAEGVVVEIGAGTGVNLGLYPPQVSSLVLVEPEEPMARRLEGRLGRSPAPVSVLRSGAEMLPLPDASCDTGVATLVLCTVQDLDQALRELRRVLRPGGKLLFLEHVRSEDPRLARWQDRMRPLWVRWGHGCQCNRSTLAAIEAAGFEVESVQHGRLPKAPRIVRPMICGVARRPASP